MVTTSVERSGRTPGGYAGLGGSSQGRAHLAITGNPSRVTAARAASSESGTSCSGWATPAVAHSLANCSLSATSSRVRGLVAPGSRTYCASCSAYAAIISALASSMA